MALKSISESTKIKLSLLDGLERGDVSQWPRGLFRRAYIRDYACAIGLPPEPLVEEFGRLFPEDGVCEDRTGPAASEPLRMTLAGEPNAGAGRVGTRAARAALEMAVVFLFGGVATVAAGVEFWTACGGVALIYYPLAAALSGRTPDPRRLGAFLARRRPRVGHAQGEARAVPARIYVVAEQRTAELPFVAVAGEELSQHHTSH